MPSHVEHGSAEAIRLAGMPVIKQHIAKSGPPNKTDGARSQHGPLAIERFARGGPPNKIDGARSAHGPLEISRVAKSA